MQQFLRPSSGNEAQHRGCQVLCLSETATARATDSCAKVEEQNFQSPSQELC